MITHSPSMKIYDGNRTPHCYSQKTAKYGKESDNDKRIIGIKLSQWLIRGAKGIIVRGIKT